MWFKKQWHCINTYYLNYGGHSYGSWASCFPLKHKPADSQVPVAAWDAKSGPQVHSLRNPCICSSHTRCAWAEAGSRWMVGDYTCRGLCHQSAWPVEEDPAAHHPLPLHHHLGHTSGTHLGIPSNFQEGGMLLSDASSMPTICHCDSSPITLQCLAPSRKDLKETKAREGPGINWREVPGGGALEKDPVRLEIVNTGAVWLLMKPKRNLKSHERDLN